MVLARLLVLVGALLLAGCGAERTPAPDVDTPRGPGARPLRPVRAPEAGVALRVPPNWRLERGRAPAVLTAYSGQAVVALWRYPRTEPLPSNGAALARARRALEREARRRDPSLRLVRGRVTRVDGKPAVEILADGRVGTRPRRLRSVHVYAAGGELVVDAYAPRRHFRRIDAAVFRPLLASLRLSTPRA